MTPVDVALLSLAGGLGAGLRWLIDNGMRARARGIPRGILWVNISGSFALGLLTTLLLPQSLVAILGVGMLGGYTTFSTVAVDAAVFWRRRERARALATVLGTVVLCTLAAVGGLLLGTFGVHVLR